VEGAEGGNFLNARAAPCRPDIEEDGFAAKFGEVVFFAVEVGKGEIRGGIADGGFLGGGSGGRWQGEQCQECGEEERRELFHGSRKRGGVMAKGGTL
jgi:hypothetical protein